MKTKTILFGSLLSLSNLVFAGEAMVSGTGRVATPPDYVMLSVNINAECYQTPSEASRSADKLAAEIYDFLKKNINMSPDSGENVLSSGGFTQPFYRYRADGSKACIGTFQKQTTITLKTKNIDGFALLFDAIQEKVYAEFQKSAGVSGESPVTYATIDTPSTQLFHATQRAKERESQALAVQEAIERFEAMFVKKCAITTYDIVEISDPNASIERRPYHESVPTSAAPGGAIPPSGEKTAPIRFDTHWVNTAINVKFRFEGGHCYRSVDISDCK